jgi:Ni/Co efflux regulator RcnB
MFSKTLACAFVAVSMLGGTAYAQRHDDDRGPPPSERHDDRNDHARGGERHDFRRGERLPPEYHRKEYVVNDWRGHHLKAPPRGYHWVQNGNDFILVAIASGVIANIILNH